MSSSRRPHHHPPPPPPPTGREDCWSETETGWLIDAWGDRYLALTRGNLRQKDWSEVAAAVNARLAAHGRPRKTDVQCKNRVDTVKKKYKLEKSKPGPSSWKFFARLDLLILPDGKKPPPLPLASSAPKPSLAFTVKTSPAAPVPSPAMYSGGSSSRSRLQSPIPSESSEDDSDGERSAPYDSGAVRKRPRGAVDGAFGELAKAVMNFADMYEKMESMKHRQMMELERKRMEFTRDLEVQRMQTFMEAQVGIEKGKRAKFGSGSGSLQGKGHNKERSGIHQESEP